MAEVIEEGKILTFDELRILLFACGNESVFERVEKYLLRYTLFLFQIGKSRKKVFIGHFISPIFDCNINRI